MNSLETGSCETSKMNIFFENIYQNMHCMKSVQTRSYFWSVFSCIRTEYGEIRSKRIRFSHDSRIGLSDLRELKFKQFQKSVKIQFVDVV